MKNNFRILIAVNDAELRKFMISIIGSMFPSEFTEVESLPEANQLLEPDRFDLIICDCDLPGGGSYVFERVKSLSPIPKFILLTNEDALAETSRPTDKGFVQLEKTFDVIKLNDLIATMFNIAPSTTDDVEFAAIPLRMIADSNSLPFDIYVRLGQSHYVKYLNGNKPLNSSEKERLKQLTRANVFVPVNDFYRYMTKVQKHMLESKVLPEHGLDHPFDLQVTHSELTRLGLKHLLNDKDLLELSQKNIKTVFAMTLKVRAFKGLLDWIDESDLSPKKFHAVLLTLFCNIILKGIKTMPYDFKAYLYLSYAAVLHDLNLDDYVITNEFRILNGLKLKSQINKVEQEKLLNHIPEIVPIISQWSLCPKEVLNVVEQHHERPDGSGFPGHLFGDKISAIAAIFIVAHDVATLVCEYRNGENLKQNMSALCTEYRGHTHFEEPLGVISNYLTAI